MESAAGRQRQVASVKEHYQLIELATASNYTTNAIGKLITIISALGSKSLPLALAERVDRRVQRRGR